MEKSYLPANHESAVYKLWEESGFFNPDNLPVAPEAPSYTIILPPPNITDKLHLGHVSMIAIEDLLIRYKRQRGFRTLWLPGTDHAAIATQNVVEKKLLKETGQSRHDLGKEKFLEEVWTFLKDTQSTIIKQITSMGASLDWSRLAFTLDEKRQLAVKKIFLDLYQAGAIYRGQRVVNWCPRCKSTLADDEIEYQEQEAQLYTFKYSAEFPISISTTRPETKLGDSAVAVNPSDERYQKFIGQEYPVDFLGAKLNIKIISDPEVEKDFGTGALGVTPAHSHSDWQSKEKHNLESYKIIDEQAKICNTNTSFDGLEVKEAREKIVAELKKRNLLEKEENIQNNLSTCYRCSSPIEPLTSEQWFVGVNQPLEKLGGLSLKEKAWQVVKDGQIKFVPARFEKKYLHWMENLRDWCISRQIWFGHQIPVWYHRDDPEKMIVGQDPQDPNYYQDEDTLDTWFSSALWTFSTLGWPEKTADLEKYHPTDVLETGYEITTLWVSRMIMLSLFSLQEIPFHTVYLHGMVLDEKGKKMSKSKGNGLDPLEVSQEFGTDAVRLSLLTGTTPGNDLRLGKEKISAQRNLVNKLWNISRYIIETVSPETWEKELEPEAKTDADRWILSCFSDLEKEVTEKIEEHEFSQALEKLISFTWGSLADWYLEIAKIEKNKDEVLSFLLKNLLILWHPFAPFVTEALWQKVFPGRLLMIQAWPEKKEVRKEEDFSLLIKIVGAIRQARNENKIEPSRKIEALIKITEKRDFVSRNLELISGLKTGLEKIEIIDSFPETEAIIIGQGQDLEIRLYGAYDENKEKARRAKEILRLEKGLESLEKLLSSPEFIDKAPAMVVEKEKKRQKEIIAELNKLKNNL